MNKKILVGIVMFLVVCSMVTAETKPFDVSIDTNEDGNYDDGVLRYVGDAKWMVLEDPVSDREGQTFYNYNIPTDLAGDYYNDLKNTEYVSLRQSTANAHEYYETKLGQGKDKSEYVQKNLKSGNYLNLNNPPEDQLYGYSTALNALSSKSGSYSDNEALINKFYQDGLLTDEEYREINGAGFWNLQEDIDYVNNLLEEKQAEQDGTTSEKPNPKDYGLATYEGRMQYALDLNEFKGESKTIIVDNENKQHYFIDGKEVEKEAYDAAVSAESTNRFSNDAPLRQGDEYSGADNGFTEGNVVLNDNQGNEIAHNGNTIYTREENGVLKVYEDDPFRDSEIGTINERGEIVLYDKYAGIEDDIEKENPTVSFAVTTVTEDNLRQEEEAIEALGDDFEMKPDIVPSKYHSMTEEELMEQYAGDAIDEYNQNIAEINKNTGLDLSANDFQDGNVPEPENFDLSALTNEGLKKVDDSDYAEYLGASMGISGLRKDDLKNDHKEQFENRELKLTNLEKQLSEDAYERYEDNFIDAVERWTGSSKPFDNREEALEAFNNGNFDPKDHLSNKAYDALKTNLNSYFITAEGDLSLSDDQIKKAFNALKKGEKLDDDKLKEILGDDYNEFTSYSYWGSFDSLSELFEALSFRGVSGIYSTINSGYADHVEERLRGWNEKYCTNIAGGVLGGKQCVFSFLCRSFGYEPGDDGTSGSDAFVELPSGMIRPTASIQAERSSLITLQDPSVYMYKITFYVKAMYEDVEFNVFLKENGEKGPELFNMNVLLEGKEEGNGDTYSARGEFAAINYHPRKFDKACVEFYKGPHSGKKICNKITVSDYSKANHISSGEDSGNQQQNIPGNDPYADSQNQQINLDWD